MSEAMKKPRTKSDKPRAWIITTEDGAEHCVTAKEVRVATQHDLMRALSGEIKTRELATKTE